jgi:hypothetical protein
MNSKKTKKINHKELYIEIEKIIINWCNDGTKTAGSLTRDIIVKMIELDYDKLPDGTITETMGK